MLFHSVNSTVHGQKIKQAIKISHNAIVFLKTDPTRSFLSLVEISFKELNQRYGSTKPFFENKKLIDGLFADNLHERAAIASGNRLAHHKLMAFAQNKK